MEQSSITSNDFSYQEGPVCCFVSGGVIDGSGAAMRRNVAVSVHGGIITAMGPAAEFPLAGETVVVDLSHCVILPGMVDCSVTLSRSTSVDSAVRLAAEEAGEEEKAGLRKRHLRDCHTHGVLGAAVSDDPAGLGEGQGWLIGLRNSGPVLRSRLDLPSRGQARDFIRIAYSNSIDDLDNPPSLLKDEELRSILSQKGGRKAVVVANGAQAVSEALAAGCDAIEQGYEMGEDNLRKMAKCGVLWIPSLLRAKNALDGSRSGGDVCCRFSTRYVAPGQTIPGAEAFWGNILAGQLAQLRLARRLGAVTATGTGAGSPGILHGESMAEEIKLFLKAGYPVEEAIRSATENGAGFFAMDKLGRLEVGKPATLRIR